jgi:hypothetical protein
LNKAVLSYFSALFKGKFIKARAVIRHCRCILPAMTGIITVSVLPIITWDCRIWQRSGNRPLSSLTSCHSDGNIPRTAQ